VAFFLQHASVCDTIVHMILLLFLFSAMPLMAQSSVHVDTENTHVRQNKPTARVMWHMPRDRRQVALTFDDGPDDDITPQLLDVLKQHNVRATFFLVGHMIAKFPHVVARIANDGHEIANHTWAHYRLDEMNQDQVGLQLSATTQALHQLNVPMAPYVRPPGGRFNNYLLHAAKNQQLTMVMWDVNAADYKQADGTFPEPLVIKHRVLRQIKPGSIVLMHNSPATLHALPGIIDELKGRGYAIRLLTR